MSDKYIFSREVVAKDIGLHDEKQAVDEILRGSYTMDNTSMNDITATNEMITFITVLKKSKSTIINSTTSTIDSIITLQDYYDISNKTRKANVSSPSSLHYGHYIAVCGHPMLLSVCNYSSSL